jgi:glucosylceramidase
VFGGLLVLLAVANLPAMAADTPVQVWLSTVDGSRRMARQPDLALRPVTVATPVRVDDSIRHQEMNGFGAALTDSAAWLMQTRLTPAARTALIRELFGRGDGIGLDFVRLTIGASDFSRRHYSLDDMPDGATDPDLAHFSIDANRGDVLPVIKEVLAVNPGLEIMASPWSPPAWMKTSNSLIKGSLKPEARGAFARYLVRYVEAYAAEGVPIHALTLQNEPHFEPDDYPGMRMDPAARAEVIGKHLGPLLAAKGLKARIYDWDHNWDEPASPLAVLADPLARRYVAGVAWHCYAGEVPAQGVVHAAYPTVDTYFTECSGGEWAPLKEEGLTWLGRNLIVGASRHWARGILLWNLALDENYGPHAGGCRDCHGVVTIDSRTGAVTRNAEYYALAHASRFVRRGARRVESGPAAGGVEQVAFRNADDGSVVLIAVNPGRSAADLVAAYGVRSFRYRMPAQSMATFVWAGMQPDNKAAPGNRKTH